MQLKRVNIGRLQTPNNVFLAPLAGYTNAPFRAMCEGLGAALTFTEMVSAKGLCYGSENTEELLKILPENGGIKAVQLFGGEPEFMARAACSPQIAPFELIDINMGCPVPKIFKNGEGSALLADIPRAKELVAAAKTSGKAVSVKFRIGLNEGRIVAEEFASAMEEAGADMLTVHGRTRDKIYSGPVNIEQIKRVKQAVKIPVIANGGVFNAADAQNLISATCADGVMVARGAMYNPFIFAEITGKEYGSKREVIEEQLNSTFKNYNARFATVYMRKMLAFYIKGRPNSTPLRLQLMSCNTYNELFSVFNSISW